VKTPLSSRNKSGFTLIELLISAALMSVLLGAAYACLKAGFDARSLVEPRGDASQAGRVALNLMTADLRNACPLHKGPEFLGMKRQIEGRDADNLDFATHHYTPKEPGEGDYCSVSWYAEKDPKTGLLSLWRRRNPTMAYDPLSGGRRDEIVSNVQAFALEFYDGFDWYETWGDAKGEAKKESSFRERPNLTGLPQAVRITLVVEPETKDKPGAATDEKSTPTITLQTVVRINVRGGGGGASGGATTGGGAP
jgi:type II secretion system protein J